MPNMSEHQQHSDIWRGCRSCLKRVMSRYHMPERAVVIDVPHMALVLTTDRQVKRTSDADPFLAA